MSPNTKTFKQFLLLLAEEQIIFDNWSMPNAETMKADFDEYKKKETRKWQARSESMGFRFPIFDTFEDFKEAIRGAHIVTVSKSFDNRVQNRSKTTSISSLKALVNSYSRPRDVDRIIDGFRSNAKMPYPIILKGSQGMWIMAGNTRLDTANILKITPKALLIDVSV